MEGRALGCPDGQRAPQPLPGPGTPHVQGRKTRCSPSELQPRRTPLWESGGFMRVDSPCTATWTHGINQKGKESPRLEAPQETESLFRRGFKPGKSCDFTSRAGLVQGPPC